MYTSAIRDLEAAGVADVRLARSLLELGGIRGIGDVVSRPPILSRAVRILEAGDQPDRFERSEAWQELSKAYSCERQYSKEPNPALQRAFDAEQSAPAPRQEKLVEILASQGVVYEAERRFARPKRFSNARS